MRALNRVELLKEEVHEYYSTFKVNNDLIELRNLISVAELTVKCALKRKESRGLHYTLDHPEARKHPNDTVITPENFNNALSIADWE